MKFLISELKKYINNSNSIDDLKFNNFFIELGFEVEEIYKAIDLNEFVQISRVLSCEKHPNADKLKFCKVETNNIIYDVVCGGKNIDANQIVIHAMPGSKIGNLVLSEREIRGIKSWGMILSISEFMNIKKELIDDLTLNDIYVFETKNELILKNENHSIEKTLDLEGKVFDLSILNDRKYAKNYLMLAKELSIIMDRDFYLEKLNYETLIENSNIFRKDFFSKKSLFSIYSEILIKDDIKTPFFIKRLLFISGIKPLNNISDLLEYIKLITGVNLEIYLDKKTYFLKFELVKENLYQELFIKYSFDLFSFLGLSFNFLEKTSKYVFESYLRANNFEFNVNYLWNFIGQKIDLDLLKPKLHLLGFELKSKDEDLYVSVPWYRSDIESVPHIIEEFIRFSGISKVKSIKPNTNKLSNIEIHQEAIFKINNLLSQYGLNELKSYKLIDFDTAKKFNIWESKHFIKLDSTYSIKHNTFQASLMNGLIYSYTNNFRKEHNDIFLFEISNIYINSKNFLSLGILIDDLFQKEENIDPSIKLKELILKIFEIFNIKNYIFSNLENENFNKYNSAKIFLNDEIIGIIGEVHPLILREQKLIKVDKIKTKLYYAEILISKLF